MLTIIIWGLILFIIGVGATYVHDHMKNFKETSASKAHAALDRKLAEQKEEKERIQAQFNALRNRSAPVAKQAGAKRVVKPGVTKTTSHKLDADDALTLQEMIDRIEGMRKTKAVGRVTDGSLEDAMTQEQFKKLIKGDNS